MLEDAHGFTAGRRVVGVYPWLEQGTGEGTYAEVALADPGWLVPLPDTIDLSTPRRCP